MGELRVYVGTYTSNGGEGIYRYDLDTDTGALTLSKTIVGVVNPSFLTLDAAGRILYAVNEVEVYYGKDEGALSAFSVDPVDGNLHFINQVSSMGAAPCHISLDHSGRTVLVANYGGGSIAAFRVEADGRLGQCLSQVRHQGSGPNPDRQAAPHAHCILVDPDNRRALAVDLGLDRILAYDLDPATGALDPIARTSAHAKPGSGPRQMVFHPQGRWAYVVHELESIVTAYAYDPADGSMSELQSLSSLPAGFDGENYGSCVQVDPRGKFLYLSNRGHDSIAYFRIDARTGTLAFQGCVATGGKFPRHFSLDPEGRFLLAANQKSDSLVVFRIDQESGAPSPTGHSVTVPAPVCVLFATAQFAKTP